jgi:hypothetical protein
VTVGTSSDGRLSKFRYLIKAVITRPLGLVYSFSRSALSYLNKVEAINARKQIDREETKGVIRNGLTLIKPIQFPLQTLYSFCITLDE